MLPALLLVAVLTLLAVVVLLLRKPAAPAEVAPALPDERLTLLLMFSQAFRHSQQALRWIDIVKLATSAWSPEPNPCRRVDDPRSNFALR